MKTTTIKLKKNSYGAWYTGGGVTICADGIAAAASKVPRKIKITLKGLPARGFIKAEYLKHFVIFNETSFGLLWSSDAYLSAVLGRRKTFYFKITEVTE